MRSAWVVAAIALAHTACTKPLPPSDAQPGLVPTSQFVAATDGGMAARSISVVLDQQPAGNRSILAVSATEIVRNGPAERFAQPNVACPNQLINGCLLTNCSSLRDVSTYPYGTVTPMALGRISISGPSRTEKFDADGGTKNRVTQSSVPIFEQGQTVKVSIAQAATPAFQRTMLVPRAVALLSPELDTAGVTISVKRSEPLEVRWAALPAGAPERVAIAVSDNVRTVTCRFDPTTGRAHVPVELLSLLEAGPGFLTVHTLWAHEDASEGWLVSVFARNVATQLDGGTAKFPSLDLQ